MFGPEGWWWGPRQCRGRPSLAVCEEEHVGTWADAVQKQPLPRESQPLAKGTHLQADLGSVQGEGEEVSKTGGSASPQELHSCCGRYF